METHTTNGYTDMDNGGASGTNYQNLPHKANKFWVSEIWNRPRHDSHRRIPFLERFSQQLSIHSPSPLPHGTEHLCWGLTSMWEAWEPSLAWESDPWTRRITEQDVRGQDMRLDRTTNYFRFLPGCHLKWGRPIQLFGGEESLGQVDVYLPYLSRVSLLVSIS